MTDAAGASFDASRGEARGERVVVEDAVGRAVAAFHEALRLSCLAARYPRRAALANQAVAAHVAARAWAEEAVRRAGEA